MHSEAISRRWSDGDPTPWGTVSPGRSGKELPKKHVQCFRRRSWAAAARVGRRSRAPSVPGRPHRPRGLTSGGSASSWCREASGLRFSAQVLVPPSCRKPEIRRADLLHLLRAEPRLLKKTAAPGDASSRDLSGRLHPKLAPSAAPRRARLRLLKRQVAPGGPVRMWRGSSSARLAPGVGVGRREFSGEWGLFYVWLYLFSC